MRIILPKTTYISVSIRGNATSIPPAQDHLTPPSPISFLLLRLYSLINKTVISSMVGGLKHKLDRAKFFPDCGFIILATHLNRVRIVSD